MKKFWIIVLSAAILAACNKKSDKPVNFVSPVEGGNVQIGSKLSLKVDAEQGAFDSIQYIVDTTYAGSKTDASALDFSTTALKLGTHLITAKVFKGSSSEEVTTNVVVLPATAPAKYSFSVVNTYPHDTSSFTEGLEYVDGKIYESDGEYGLSSLRIADLKTGKVLKSTEIESKYFAEGITVIGDKIVQLTYREHTGFVYDRNNLQKLREFPYNAGQEGWGLAFDGKQILNTDGTNNIYFLNKDDFHKEKTLEVYDNKGAVTQLNELEFIDGKIYANIWQTNRIVIIDPATGVVESEIDLVDLYPEETRNPKADVLNGIAWDARTRRLFVTGKKWDKLFEIKIKKIE